MKPIPLFGTGIKSLSEVITSQRRLNCFFDIRVDQDKSAIVLIGTPGHFRSYVIPTGPIYGWIVVGSLIYVVAAQSLYSVSIGGSVTFLGNLPTTTQNVSMADNGLQICIVDGVAGYIHDYSTSTFRGAITDPAFPNGCLSVAVLNSRFICERPDSRQFSVGQQLNGTLWTPSLFATKENYSDYISAIDVVNGMLVLWGFASIEFWQDAALVPQPYQRIEGSTQTWGLAAHRSKAFLGNTMIFLAQNPQGGVQVLKLNGYTPARVSDSDVESIIIKMPIWQDAVALTYMVYGHPMYQLTFPTAKRSLLYDDSTGIWYETQTGAASVGRHAGNLGIAFNGKNFISDSTSGSIYQLDSDTYTDNGDVIKRQISSRHVRIGGNNFTVDEIALEMETGVGTVSGQGLDPQIMMQISRDGGRTFGPEDWTPIGKAGEFEYPRVKWDRCGDAIDFVFQWTMTDPVKFVVTLGEAMVRPGTQGP